MIKNPLAEVGDEGSIPGWGRSPGGGSGNPFQYSCLGNPMDGGAGGLQCMGSQKSQTQLSDETTASLHLPIPVSQFIPPHSPPDVLMAVLYVCVSISALQIHLDVLVIFF